MATEQDKNEIDSVFRSINREIWIVTSAAGERRGGLVATWVSQSSLDPNQPMVAVGIAPNHFTAELINESGGFALHLITREQINLAWQFAIGSGRDHDKLADVPFATGLSGSPVLQDCLAWLDCKVVSRYDTGDRLYFWADVIAGRRQEDAEPLRANDLFAAASDTQRDALIENLRLDIEVQQPLAEQWRKGLKAT